GYRQVQRQLLEMRREGVTPYSTIADNTRWMRKPRTYASLADALEITAAQYRASVWATLDTHVEVWCEKDALASVLYQETHRFDVPLMVARGYSSESFAFEAADAIRNSDKDRAWIYYVGDFDPSGWDMSENLKTKLLEFIGNDIDVQFIRLAITPAQVNTLNLPSRPTKTTDTRCKRFFELFGNDAPSIELDAIHPNQLRQLVRDTLVQHLPDGWLDRIEQEEHAARETLADIAQHWAV
ncbi:MAG: hypothetical protein KDJ99_24870, partial [Candidatus Competibacteraceae bacterium]|nr:hypothetical protein [Candidatus Competibacteraceae bacterium]